MGEQSSPTCTVNSMSYLLELRALVGSRPLFSVGASVVVFDAAGRVLMQRRADTGTWGFPGGSSELGDSLEDTARRELLEETGLHADALEFVAVLSGATFAFTYPNGDEVYNVGAVYVARSWHGTLSMDAESLELAWFAPDALPSDLMGPITQWIAANISELQGV
jgi:8-oxo-dGTP pyrophosphatase MutT (NUDIX family)